MTVPFKVKAKALQQKAEGFSILYVEDEKKLRDKIVFFLHKFFSQVETAEDGEAGLDKYLEGHYDIVITDIFMPNMDGLEFIRQIRERNETQEIIVVSANTDSEYLTQCIRLGVADYILKPIDIDQTLFVLEKSVNRLKVFRENEMYKTKLETMVEQRTQTVLQLQEELVNNYADAMQALVKMVERRDAYTGGHSERVAHYSRDIAREMGLSNEECDLIYQAGILHDVGKIMTPDAILLKPGRLSDLEYGLIKDHVSAGYEILSEIPMYKELAEVVYAHHEHYDGSGYPRQLKGEEIPLLARVMVVSDVFDAMTTSRIYKTRKSIADAVAELLELSGSWFDPEVIKSAVTVLKTVDIAKHIAQEPHTDIEDERYAYFYKDPLTRLYNHDYLDFVLLRNQEEKTYSSLHLVCLTDFTAFNQKNGWGAGDLLLTEFAAYLQASFFQMKVFRVFGDDFALLGKEGQEVEIETINATPLLKNNQLSCRYTQIDLKETDIDSYQELMEDLVRMP